MVDVVSKVDKKGRILIPAEVRDEMNIKPMSKVKVKIEEVVPRKSFLKLADDFRESNKEKEDAVKVLHKESPFR